MTLGAVPSAIAGDARGGAEAPATPADRAAVQRDTKDALVETKLADEDLSALFGELEGFMRDYSRWVLEAGPTEAAEQDAEELVRAELEPIFESRAVALSGQRALIKLAASRIEAIRAHAERIRVDQAKVKAEIEDADLDDPEFEGAVLQAALAFANERFADAAIVGRTGDNRPAAVEIAKADLLPIIANAELPEKNAQRLCEVVADWMEARALLEDEARLRPSR
jgi:hypothetical protein